MLRIRLHMPEHVYAAAVAPGSRAAPEWPPAPWRLAAALLAGASILDGPQCSAARAALARLEQAEPPVWHLPPASTSRRPAVWASAVVPDSVTSPPLLRKVLDLPSAATDISDQRTKYPQYPVRVVTTEPTAWMDVDVALSENELDALSEAALAVPYVGQATHPADVGILTPDGAGNWTDHTSPDGTCHAEMAAPGAQHERWVPSSRQNAVSVRCWRPGMLQVLDEDHRRRSSNQAGVAEHLKGRTVHYAPARRRSTGSWHLVGLQRPTRDVVATMQALPVEPGAVLPLVGGERLLGLLCHDADTLLQLQRSMPDEMANDDRVRRVAGRFLATAYRWRSATPVAAHADARVARAQLEQEFAVFGELSAMRLEPAERAAQPVRGLATWHVDVTFAEPVRGPLRVGEGAASGAGVLVANDIEKEN